MTASSGCVILAEIDDTASPQSITAMIPICTGATSTVNWPFSSGGLGVKSNMAIYAGLTASGGGSAPGCYMSLENMQVEYLLSRDLKWDTSVNELWDNTAGGYLLDSTTYAVMGWYVAFLFALVLGLGLSCTAPLVLSFLLVWYCQTRRQLPAAPFGIRPSP